MKWCLLNDIKDLSTTGIYGMEQRWPHWRNSISCSESPENFIRFTLYSGSHSIETKFTKYKFGQFFCCFFSWSNNRIIDRLKCKEFVDFWIVKSIKVWGYGIVIQLIFAIWINFEHIQAIYRNRFIHTLNLSQILNFWNFYFKS